jgi:hypothetical protein
MDNTPNGYAAALHITFLTGLAGLITKEKKNIENSLK